VRSFREKHPEHAATRVVAVNTPDFTGCFETGYASALLELLKEMKPAPVAAPDLNTINVLAASMLTPGDIEELEDLAADFGLKCRVVPNVAGSLAGELTDVDYSPVSLGGTNVEEVERMGDAALTLVIGHSLTKAGTWLEQQTGVKSCLLPHLHTLRAVDELVHILLKVSGHSAPSLRVTKQRRQLTDAMLDTHFVFGERRFAIATDADLLLALTELVQLMGSHVVAAVTPSAGEALAQVPLKTVQLGDLEDLEHLARGAAQVLLGNSHAAETAERLGIPLVRIGFPLFDTIGAYAQRWIGYRGVRQTLFDLANVIHKLALDEVPVFHAKHSLKARAGA
jgi:nitrogenase molybdenum-iron protein NifN